MCWAEGVGWDGVEMHVDVRVREGVCEGAVQRSECVYVIVPKQQPFVNKQEHVNAS